MVDLASHPSRRTVVKAGLWAAPALAVVNLSLMSAAHASVSTPPCITTYPSHAFAVFLVGGTYYSIKFGDGTATKPVPGDDGNTFDQAFLAGTSPYAGMTVIEKGNEGSLAQKAVYASLLAGLKVATFSYASGVGYTITAAPAGLVGVYAYDGSFTDNVYRVHTVELTGSQFLITKCAGKVE